MPSPAPRPRHHLVPGVSVDLGPVRYEPPLTRSAPHGPTPRVLRTGPRWVRGATRWHRVRSGMVMPLGHTALHLWCGQGVSLGDRPSADTLPEDGAPLCGTCEGRAAGAGHPSPLGVPDTGLRFDPMRLRPPRWCPGGGPYGPARHLAVRATPDSWRVLVCGACGELVPTKRAYGWQDSGEVPAQHEPGPGLVPGCPQHAWRYLVRTTEGVACACAGLEAAG